MDTTTSLTMDAIEQSLADGEATIARVRRSQMVLIREADRRQAPLIDGCRSMAEWVTGRLDVAPETAKTLVSTARRLVSNRHRMTRDTEREVFETRYVAVQPNLDESSWRVHGQLPATAGRCFVDALDAKADRLPSGLGGDRSRTTRYADALWAISLDSLAGTDGATIESATPLLTVFVDAHDAAATGGETGVIIEAGPRVGPATLEAILCDGVVEVTGRTQDGTPLAMGRRTRTIPPRLKRFILARDGAVCTIEGCISRYRLQPHHITPWSEGGATEADNLTTLCWFHHHIVIHGRGFTINPDTPPQRRRLNRPPIHAPPRRE
ncbi:MAG: HNH endonuclease [Acidimicrobiia bacterium]|nr:HNH endonuclease [Acidimicrobiia bacterium]